MDTEAGRHEAGGTEAGRPGLVRTAEWPGPELEFQQPEPRDTEAEKHEAGKQEDRGPGAQETETGKQVTDRDATPEIQGPRKQEQDRLSQNGTDRIGRGVPSWA